MCVGGGGVRGQVKHDGGGDDIDAGFRVVE